MIKEERMVELINEGAVIYHIFKGDVYLVDLTMVKVYGGIGAYEYENDYYHCNVMFSLNAVFEDREEAEWVNKFGSVCKTQVLSFPTWEEFQTGKTITFWVEDTKYSLYRWMKKGKYKHIMISADRFGYGGVVDDWFVFQEEPTKENYIKACRKCIELFRGEK